MCGVGTDLMLMIFRWTLPTSILAPNAGATLPALCGKRLRRT